MSNTCYVAKPCHLYLSYISRYYMLAHIHLGIYLWTEPFSLLLFFTVLISKIVFYFPNSFPFPFLLLCFLSTSFQSSCINFIFDFYFLSQIHLFMSHSPLTFSVLRKENNMFLPSQRRKWFYLLQMLMRLKKAT